MTRMTRIYIHLHTTTFDNDSKFDFWQILNEFIKNSRVRPARRHYCKSYFHLWPAGWPHSRGFTNSSQSVNTSPTPNRHEIDLAPSGHKANQASSNDKTTQPPKGDTTKQAPGVDKTE